MACTLLMFLYYYIDERAKSPHRSEGMICIRRDGPRHRGAGGGPPSRRTHHAPGRHGKASRRGKVDPLHADELPCRLRRVPSHGKFACPNAIHNKKQTFLKFRIIKQRHFCQGPIRKTTPAGQGPAGWFHREGARAFRRSGTMPGTVRLGAGGDRMPRPRFPGSGPGACGPPP